MPYTDFKSQAEWKMYFHQNVQKAVYPRVLEYLPKMGSVTSLVDLTDWAAAKPKISPPVHTWYPGQITLLLRDGKDTLYGQNWTRPSLIWMVLGQSYKTHSHSICPAIHLSLWSNQFWYYADALKLKRIQSKQPQMILLVIALTFMKGNPLNWW